MSRSHPRGLVACWFMCLGRSILGWSWSSSRSRSATAWVSPLAPRRNLPIHRYYSLGTPQMSSQTLPCSEPTRSPMVVVLAGSTGIGKSDVAAVLSRRLSPALIVSADSVQAYRHVQIGANKPTAEELAETPHLLIDVADANDTYNAAEWMEDVLYVIESLQGTGNHSNLAAKGVTRESHDPSRQETSRQRSIDSALEDARTRIGHTAITTEASEERARLSSRVLPLVVGGTMMYLQWLVHGRPDAPSPTPEALAQAKATIQRFETTQDWEGARTHALSQHPGLETPIRKLSPNDWYRLRRILEVGYTVSSPCHSPRLDVNTTNSQSDPTDQYYSGVRAGGLLSLGYDVRCFFLCPHDRMLQTRIVDARCETMLLRGLLRETCDLALARQLPDMAAKAIGYRQVLHYLGREGAKDNDYDAFVEFLEDFTTATRQYSRRQMQWFRKDEHFVFSAVDVTKAKDERVRDTAKEIERLIGLSRADFDAERLSREGSSFLTRLRNEEQAKGMKRYIFQQQILKPGSLELEQVMKEADECTHQYQAKRVQRLPATA